MTKQKTRKELERDMKEWRTVVLVCFLGLLFVGVLLIIEHIDKNKLENQLSEYQDKIPETWSCPVLLEKGMYSLRDGGILISPSGIEIKCSKVPDWTFKMKCSIPVDIHGSDILLYLKYLNYEQNFTDYNDYLTMKKVIDNDENCEVIE